MAEFIARFRATAHCVRRIEHRLRDITADRDFGRDAAVGEVWDWAHGAAVLRGAELECIELRAAVEVARAS